MKLQKGHGISAIAFRNIPLQINGFNMHKKANKDITV
jgi:hypothetical protein